MRTLDREMFTAYCDALRPYCPEDVERLEAAYDNTKDNDEDIAATLVELIEEHAGSDEAGLF
jgi:hypothetical protein